MKLCKCGCGQSVPRPNKAYVDKEHQMAHFYAGEARVLGAISGRQAVESGRLATAGLKGAARAREIAQQFRATHVEVEHDHGAAP